MPRPSRSTDLSTEACIRKPTRPQKPGCRYQVKRLNDIYPLPKQLTPSLSLPRRRVLTPKVLAKIVSRRVHKKPDAITEDVAKRYTLNSDQRRITFNQIKAMRAIHRQIVTDMRKELPVRRSEENMDTFLNTLAVKLGEVSTSDSADEFE